MIPRIFGIVFVLVLFCVTGSAHAALISGEVHVWETQEIILESSRDYPNAYSDVDCWIELARTQTSKNASMASGMVDGPSVCDLWPRQQANGRGGQVQTNRTIQDSIPVKEACAQSNGQRRKSRRTLIAAASFGRLRMAMLCSTPMVRPSS